MSMADDRAAELDRVLRELLRRSGPRIEAAAEALAAALRAGRKVLIFGNGGSAAEAQHFAAELVNGLMDHGRPPRAAVALTTDTSALTAIGNDRGFDQVFSRQIEALGGPGDAAVALTTSGRSPDVIRGLVAARAGGLLTIALTGSEGCDVAPLADHLLEVPSRSTARVQEAHLFLLHILAEKIESAAA
ncbi:MAG TPA: SIS domain-containing protein [Candidatus Aminicenantes bacterium]|nr:SIS domain-containing protein [Candidatus Aminicenantes bacterium]HRY64302.1 SIS domain-containing protein [Candidatus Aminicenantes bacterium]HRZ71215.1 SIS domain-containing protein [Candidatus Aminicenantes bacterium]